MLEEILELKEVSVPDIRRLHEGSGQGIYPIYYIIIKTTTNQWCRLARHNQLNKGGPD
jgi:hypothetical protein